MPVPSQLGLTRSVLASRGPHEASPRAVVGAIAALAALALALPPAAAQTANGEGSDAIGFQAAQARSGQTAYEEHCASCHGRSLQGMHLSPSLVGERFDRAFRGKQADVLAMHLRRMPLEPSGQPGSLSEETYTNVMAYLLASNGFSAGERPLPASSELLADFVIPQIEEDEDREAAPVSPRVAAANKKLLESMPAVTREMLESPGEGDWLHWGRTYDGQAYSPLTSINKRTVKELKVAWRLPLTDGLSMSMPLVNHGIMFLQTFPDTVLALDATNGRELWRYRHASKIPSQKMGLALSGEKVLVPTSDLHLIALHAKTGELLWDHTIDPKAPEGGRGIYQLRSAPLIVGKHAIQGVTASFMPRGGFIVAVDIETGKEAWRFNTIARPGEPGGNTWNGVPLDERSGGSVWHQGTYDKELDLVYFGIAPTYDTGPLLHPSNQPNTSSEALYTNCTVALRPATGELVWHYQHMANDQWDLDWVFERQIVTLPIEGKDRRVVLNIGKMAILDALDAATGEYLFSLDAGVQNVISAIDEETGAKTYDMEKWPDPTRDVLICPTAFGARSWPPAAYSPQTRLVYAPLTEWCMNLGPEGFQLLTSGVGITGAAHPDTGDGMLGRLQAYDLETRELAWTRHQVTPPTTGILATAGGVVFSGDLDPSLKAFDDESGALLWQAPLDDNPSSSLITYRVNDAQYVAVVVGLTNNHVRDTSRAMRTFRASQELPEASTPKGGAAVWVFCHECTR